MFDPTIGRWLEEDPEGFEAGDPNLSRYCGNDPTNLTDPSGLEPSYSWLVGGQDLAAGVSGNFHSAIKWQVKTKAGNKGGTIVQFVEVRAYVFNFNGVAAEGTPSTSEYMEAWGVKPGSTEVVNLPYFNKRPDPEKNQDLGSNWSEEIPEGKYPEWNDRYLTPSKWRSKPNLAGAILYPTFRN